MDRAQLSHPIVKAAITALHAGDRKAWLALFVPDAVLTDDGSRRSYVEWSDTELFGKGNGRIIDILSEQDNGLTVNTLFHSNVWGEFKTFWTFQIQGDKIARLDVGQLAG
ncbi:MAG: nuclear transport factor 2 family protein [Anaerolineaceae bacterium]|nr:nuclear transport factor 2 family protein [Anaerolineaceae bacterium]